MDVEASSGELARSPDRRAVRRARSCHVVLHELEAQRVDEELDRWVVLINDDGDEIDVHHTNL